MIKRIQTVVLATCCIAGFGIKAARADILYVSNGDNTIVKFTSGGVGSVFASSGLNFPIGIAFDSAGSLYAANSDNTIEKFTSGGVGSVFASSRLDSPRGLAFDSAGNLYAANSDPASNTIESLSEYWHRHKS